jgi:CDP-paratose 2-epimerase
MTPAVHEIFSSPRSASRRIVITGGCGFIGSNLAANLLADSEEVVLIDNLSRPGVEQNLASLQEAYPGRVRAEKCDVRDFAAIALVLSQAKAVFHLAAQTAVTTSLADPGADFEVNARGTLNVLEAVRQSGRRIPVIFASTNKVYGGLEDVGAVVQGDRRQPVDPDIARRGIDETRRLDFYTPYGCSKGVADQYVLDYARSFDLPTAVLRMSCIYGPRQFGTEDQGWVAHFLLSALSGQPISVYGDGTQVRDILHVDDAVVAYRAVLADIDRLKGQAFNLGGGPANAVSLRILLDEIERIVGRDVETANGPWRQGDQLYFVSDTRKLAAATGWQARVAWRDGVRGLAEWLAANRLDRVDRSRRRVTA